MPLLLQKNLSDTCQLAVWHITESVEDLRTALQLSKEEEAFLASITHPDRMKSWLGSRVLLRHLVNTDQFIEMKVTEQGKPFLGNFSQHISISHSGEYAAAIISEEHPVGVDLEKVRDKVQLVAKKFLAADELAFIDPANTVDHLTQCWCAKEAVFKWYGKGNLPFKEGIVLSPFSVGSNSIQATLYVDTLEQALELQCLRLGDYMISWLRHPALLA